MNPDPPPVTPGPLPVTPDPLPVTPGPAARDPEAPAVYAGKGMASYGFTRGSRPDGSHYFGPDRFPAFRRRLVERGLDRRVRFRDSGPAADGEILLFHTPEHLERVRRLCAAGEGALDHGPTPAQRGMDGAAAHVVGAVIDAAREILAGRCRRAFVPVSGFHHAHPAEARNYCLFNDCAVGLRFLEEAGLTRIAYVDIDAHHGDGVYAAFAGDPRVVIADLHQDERTLFPGTPEAPLVGPVTGERGDTGTGPGEGTKLNLPLAPYCGDAGFLAAWEEAEAFLDRARPEFVMLQAGADGLAGDLLGSLDLSAAVHREVTGRLCALAERHGEGRLLALGGGGYHLENLAEAWCAVVEAMVESPAGTV